MVKGPLFDLGAIVATPGALEALEEAHANPGDLLRRHVSGDWGELTDDDKHENELSIKNDWRILSAYVLAGGVKLWVITNNRGR